MGSLVFVGQNVLIGQNMLDIGLEIISLGLGFLNLRGRSLVFIGQNMHDRSVIYT